MLSKTIFKKLDEYLKKYEGHWLTDKYEESGENVPSLRGFPGSKKTSDDGEKNLVILE